MERTLDIAPAQGIKNVYWLFVRLTAGNEPFGLRQKVFVLFILLFGTLFPHETDRYSCALSFSPIFAAKKSRNDLTKESLMPFTRHLEPLACYTLFRTLWVDSSLDVVALLGFCASAIVSSLVALLRITSYVGLGRKQISGRESCITFFFLSFALSKRFIIAGLGTYSHAGVLCPRMVWGAEARRFWVNKGTFFFSDHVTTLSLENDAWTHAHCREKKMESEQIRRLSGQINLLGSKARLGPPKC